MATFTPAGAFFKPCACLLILGLVLTTARLRADEPTSADKQGQIACLAAGQLLATQRPEGLAGVLVAVTPSAKEPAPVSPPTPLLEDRLHGPLAVVEIVGIQDPLTSVAMLQRGFQAGLWVGKPVRDPVADKDRLLGVEDRKAVLTADQNLWESQAYCYLVFHAREVPVDALKKIARSDISYAQLWDDPKKYRGEALHIEGRLRKLVKMDAPKILSADGIKTLYEGWIFPDDYGANPYCVIFSELPKGVQPGEKVEYPVSLDAYFFKRYRYKTVNNDTRDTPLFIGRTFALRAAAAPKAEPPGPFEGVLIPTVLTVIGSLAVLFFGLNWWFRRGDHAVQRRIREARNTEFIEPLVNESPRETPSDRGGMDLGSRTE